MVKAKQSEEVKKQQSVIHPKSPTSGHNIDNISKNRPPGPQRRDEKQQFPRGSKLSKFDDKPKCMRCLGNPHPRKLCPASDSTCNKCSKKGHWAKACGENWGSPSKHLNEPRQVPIPLRQKTEQELQRMERNSVISRVDEPTEWCAPMVITQKSNGNVRVCC